MNTRSKHFQQDVDGLRRLIRHHLAETGLTATQFAATLGLSAPFMSQVMTGKKLPTDAILSAIGATCVVSYVSK